MLSRILVSLLVVAIQACPLCCTQAMRAPLAHSAAAKPLCCSCCCGLHRQGGDDQSHAPRRSAPGPADSGAQCICTGAVVDRAKPFELQVERTFDVVMATVPLAIISLSQPGVSLDSPSQQMRATPGQLVRCLHMSYLC